MVDIGVALSMTTVKHMNTISGRRATRGPRLVVWFVAMGLAAVSCAGTVDILAEGEREAGPPDEQPVAVPQPTAAELATATPAPLPTATPTPTPLPTATPVPTPLPTPTPTPTPTPLPEPASVTAPATVRALVGDTVQTDITASSPADNPVTSIRLQDAPPGMTGISRFTPRAAGTWEATVVVTDSLGRQTRQNVTFVARYPRRSSAVVAMGDSIASGHGLDLRDYLGRDTCFRSDDGYPRRVVDALVSAGDLPQNAELALVACSGFDTAELSTKLVTGGIKGTEPPGGGRRTQLDWAVQANPRFVLLSTGINDLGFVDPARFVVDGHLDTELVQSRLAGLRRDLASVVERLVAATDATIVVAGYYNPTAPRPQGVDGCEAQCFYAVTAEAVESLNTAIRDALPTNDRVVFVDLASPFVGHGAPNGLGPDDGRAGGGFLGGLLGEYFSAIQPYCAKGETQGEPWINYIDCVHPTRTGAAAIARSIIAALDR